MSEGVWIFCRTNQYTLKLNEYTNFFAKAMQCGKIVLMHCCYKREIACISFSTVADTSQTIRGGGGGNFQHVCQGAYI